MEAKRVYFMAFKFRAIAIIVAASIFCAGCTYQQGNPEEAALTWQEQARAYESASEWKKAADARGEAAEAWESQADVLEDAGDLEKACMAQEEAALCWNAQGDSHRKDEQWKKAIEAYKKAAEIWEMASEGWERAGYIDSRKDALENAAQSWFHIGLVHTWLSDCEKMAEAYETAAQLCERAGSDERAEFYRQLAETCEESSP